MTLIVAAHVQDHLILAGDHCAVLSAASNDGPPDLVLDRYRKVYPWEYGAMAGAGSVFLLASFCRAFWRRARAGRCIDLAAIGAEAQAAQGRHATGNVFLTLPTDDGFGLFCVRVGAHRAESETIAPISAQFSLREGSADPAACEAFVRRLRPACLFADRDAFHRHHLDLLRGCFAQYSSVDDRITATFDVAIIEQRSGLTTFWHVADPPRALIELRLPHRHGDEDGDAAGLPLALAGVAAMQRALAPR